MEKAKSKILIKVSNKFLELKPEEKLYFKKIFDWEKRSINNEGIILK